MNKNIKTLVAQMKEHDQDYEFYPTTKEIISTVCNDLKKVTHKHFSILDIGAGNGNFFDILESMNPGIIKDGYREGGFSLAKYAIEKSNILINQMKPDIFVIGTDFYEQTLIDKRVNIIFCNPPYSDFVTWTEKIILEANCQYIYLVIPERWKEQEKILKAIEKREASYETLGMFDFLSADRASRADVDIVKIRIKSVSFHNDSPEVDPFDVWFQDHFKINTTEDEVSEYAWEKAQEEKIKSNIVKGQNIIERLEELYMADFDLLLKNYKAVGTLNSSILKELGVNVKAVKEGLKMKIKGLKNLYWHELFDNMSSITNRLTKKSREKLLGTLTAHTSIDFTIDNAYAVVLWAIKNANIYLDEQLKEVYREMTRSENVINYKSNKKMIEDGWRYCREYTHYILDYRIVLRCHACFDGDVYSGYRYRNGLSDNAHDYINDIITIAYNLGFDGIDSSYNFNWIPGELNTFNYSDGVFMSVRAYKNGNIHCKMNQKFMKKFNIEAGRLNGWIKSAQEAEREMDVSADESVKYYKTNIQIPIKNLKLIA